MSRTFSAPRVNREEVSLDGKTPSFSQTFLQPMQRNKQDNHSGISHFEKQAKHARCTAQRSGNRVTTHAQRKPHRKGRRTKGSSSFTRACLKDPLRNLPLAEDFVVGLDLRQNFSRIHQGRLSFSSMVTFHTMSLL